MAQTSRSQRRWLVLAVAIAAAVVFPISASNPFPAKAATTESPFPDVTTVIRPIDHAITMTQAVALGTQIGETILGYRYENDLVIGEYVPTADFTPVQFDDGFINNYGTSAQVVAFVVERPTVIDASGNLATPNGATFISNLPQFVAVAGHGTANAKLQNFATRARSTAPIEKISATTASVEWRPTQVETDVTHYGNRAYFSTYLAWLPGSSPQNLPRLYGFEVQVDLFNNASSTNVRPRCATSTYKDDFFAKNHGYSWSVLNSDYSPLPKSINAYADVNDYLDKCNRNSMSIGIANPLNIPLSPNNVGYALLLTINAPKGTQNSNLISGDIQLVDRTFCALSLGTTSLTDCMGVAQILPVDVPAHRATLGAYHNWAAPDRCWMSNGNFGALPPTTVAGGATGCGY